MNNELNNLGILILVLCIIIIFIILIVIFVQFYYMIKQHFLRYEEEILQKEIQNQRARDYINRNQK